MKSQTIIKANDTLPEKIDTFKEAGRVHRMIEEIEDYAILLLDIDGNILNWNKGAEKIKGYKADEIIGKNFRLFYTTADTCLGTPDQLLTRARTENHAQELGWRVRKDGSTFWAIVTITAIHNSEGVVTGFSKVTRDLTKQKQVEDELLSKNKQLEQFVYIASHDLQEPLRTVSSFIELFEQDYSNQFDENGRQYIKFITEATGRMSQLIKGLLDYSRLGINSELKLLDISKIVQDVKSDLHAIIEQTHATIHVHSLPKLNGYEIEIRLLFQNLLNNAIKFSRKGIAPQITISADFQDNIWQFKIEDNGIGISEIFHDRIFLIFQRLHDRDLYDGIGIGLAHCKKIVELHNGKIWVDSLPGLGSTFYFTIKQG